MLLFCYWTFKACMKKLQSASLSLIDVQIDLVSQNPRQDGFNTHTKKGFVNKKNTSLQEQNNERLTVAWLVC